MNEGYWINYKADKVIPITEHETWIRDPKNARKLGVPASVHTFAQKIKNRDKYLMFLMEHAPIMRVRGHGAYVSFEFHSRSRQDPMESIWMWGKQNAGPFTTMLINNFATKESTQMSFTDFEEQMDIGGVDAVLRVAKATRRFKVSVKIARELLAISKQLLSQER